MSNLLKAFTVQNAGKGKRVIDYNEIIKEKVNSISFSSDISGDGFSAGFGSMNIEAVDGSSENIIGYVSGEEHDSEEVQGETVPEVENPEDILKSAKLEAERILADARAEADVLMSNAKLEAEQIYADAKDNGYAEGMKISKSEADEYIAVQSQHLSEERESMLAELKRQQEIMEPDLVDVILRIFEKITRAVSVDKKDMILNLVNNVMSKGDADKNYVIRACNEDASFLRENKDMIINATRKDIHVEIVSDTTLTKNQCLIETESGVYDCSLDIQLENLINDIRILSCTGE